MRRMLVILSIVSASVSALDDAAVREKMKELSNPDPKVRAAAVEELSTLSADLNVALSNAARDQSPEVLVALRNAALKRVAQFNPRFTGNLIAANETAAAKACIAFCEAQMIYHRTDYDRDGVLEYAQSLGGDNSLLENKAGAGDLLLIDATFAAAELGTANPKPKAGYFFKVLKRQGPAAIHSADRTKQGARDYVVNGNMTGGFAILAIPAEYGITGKMSFITNDVGTIWQRDLGPGTKAAAEKITEFNPESGWLPAE